MLGILISKEVREIIGSFKFIIIFAACAALIIISFYVGARNHEVNITRYEAAKAENLRQLEGLTDWMEITQQRIFLPPSPLASLVSGISNDIGRTVEIQGRGELVSKDSRYSDDLIYAVFRFMDLEFIFVVILSLFAIIMGYNSICGEKEQGTLKLTFANAVPRFTYLLGKLMGSWIALIVPLILALLVGVLVLLLMNVPFAIEDWLRLGLIVLMGLVYVSVFLTLSILVSSLTQRASNSFLVVLAIWIMSVFIIPRGAVLLAGRAVDVPHIDGLNAQKSRYASQLFKEDSENMSQFKPSSNDDPQKMVEEFNAFMDSTADARSKKLSEFVDRLNEDRDNRLRQQARVSLGLARLSPATSMTLAATSLARTSIGLNDHFLDEAAAYQESYGKFMKEKTGLNLGGSVVMMKLNSGDEEPPPTIDPDELPKFEYSDEPLAESIKNGLVDIGILAMYNLLFFAGAFIAFGRYDLR